MQLGMQLEILCPIEAYYTGPTTQINLIMFPNFKAPVILGPGTVPSYMVPLHPHN